MEGSARAAVVAVVALLGGACAVQLGDIQATEPIRIVAFTGSHVELVHCLRLRLRNARLEDRPGEALSGRETLVLYSSTPRWASYGMSYYSLTVKKTGANEGSVEWRIFNQAQIHELDKAFAARFWTPVERCIEDVKKVS